MCNPGSLGSVCTAHGSHLASVSSMHAYVRLLDHLGSTWLASSTSPCTVAWLASIHGGAVVRGLVGIRTRDVLHDLSSMEASSAPCVVAARHMLTCFPGTKKGHTLSPTSSLYAAWCSWSHNLQRCKDGCKQLLGDEGSSHVFLQSHTSVPGTWRATLSPVVSVAFWFCLVPGTACGYTDQAQAHVKE